jgi:alpha-tubulin suppressor-like RCC1 family protein
VRGVSKDGESVFSCWGRSDMGQLSSSAPTTVPFPVSLIPPPEQQVSAVWCGSEFLVVRTTVGELWGRGWAEHGNLGDGQEGGPVAKEWQRTRGGSGGAEVVVGEWEGMVACGGAHCLALVESTSTEL